LSDDGRQTKLFMAMAFMVTTRFFSETWFSENTFFGETGGILDRRVRFAYPPIFIIAPDFMASGYPKLATGRIVCSLRQR
jgi:hypothetical protein